VLNEARASVLADFAIRINVSANAARLRSASEIHVEVLALSARLKCHHTKNKPFWHKAID
jgi:hypothetical protein